MTKKHSPALSPVKWALLQQRLKRAALGNPRRSMIPRRPDPDSAPVSFAQSQMWVIDQMTPGNPAYNLPYGYRLRGPLDVTALENSFNEIIKRHEVLRTTFAVKDGEPFQIIHPRLNVRIKVTQLDHLGGRQREDTLQSLASEESVRSFDLSRLPLIRISLFALGEAEHVLIVNLHHIIADGMSVGLIMDELDAFYQAFASGSRPRLSPLTVQYGDYAHWQRTTTANEAARSKQAEFWRSRLAGELPVLELPIDKPRPALQSFRGANVFFNIPAPLARDLRSLGAREGCTVFMTVLAAFQVLLRRHSGAGEVLIGTPVAVRTPGDVEPLIGNFLNMTVLRCDLSGNPAFNELLRRCRETALDAFSNSDLPFEAVMEHLKFERDPSRNPIFQVLLQVLPALAPKLGGLEVSGFFFDLKFAQFDLSLHLYENSGGYSGRFEYCVDLFETQSVQRLCDHFLTLLNGIVREPAHSLSMLPMLGGAERRQLLADWNNTASGSIRKDVCLHGLIEEQAQRTPGQTAVTFDRQTLTYDELNRRANQLAHFLRGKGVGPDVLVGLFAGRSIDMLIGMLGILKAGGAYVPIDPDYPRERVACILRDAGAPVILTQDSLAERLPKGAGEFVRLDADWAQIACESSENPVSRSRPDHLAYVLFTSGSTGTPKGVALEHRSSAAFVQWATRIFTKRELSAVLFSTSICFDLSVFEVFATLSAGGKIVMARNALQLPALPEKDEVTLINTVPSAIAELLRMGGIPPSVRTVALAGETLPDSLAEQVYAKTRCGKVYNLYGPTETTTYSTCALVRRGRPVTIGGPIAGTQCYILDNHRRLVPIGVAGELYIAGAGLARGYYGRPDLTNERFVPNPFSREHGGRMYRTGDRCRWLPDGSMQFLGRLDHQVKLRGFRIELGEIETNLAKHPAVREVVVTVREDGPSGKCLAAYLAADNPSGGLDAELRALLRRALPEYMIPAQFVVLKALPRTPNGKLDRKALPAPGAAGDAPPRGRAVAPRTTTEERVLAEFRAVLGRADFGVLDSFFDLGGHSLMAARLIAGLRAASGADVPLSLLFGRPTAAGLAEAIDALEWLDASGAHTGATGDHEEIVL